MQQALEQSRAGDVVCLSAGKWGEVTLTGIAAAGPLTLAAAPGPPVHLAGMTISGQADAITDTRNLTVEGFWIDRGVQDVTDSSGGLVWRHNTIEHVRQGYGFYLDADGNGGHHVQSGVRILDNRIDHVGACLEVVGGTARDLTFSHNVCGPGIGYGDTASDQPGHYVEVGGVAGLTVRDNVFRGPAASAAATAGLHLNVLHVFGGGRNIDFSGNILFHTQARGQAILLQEGPMDRVTINDNIDVEDPACASRTGMCGNYMVEAANAHGLSFRSNTVIGATLGVLLTVSDESGDYRSGRDYAITGNIVVGAKGAHDISYGGCVADCVFNDNVTDDDSAAQGGAARYVTGWTPRWSRASREPVGLPFPAGRDPSAG